MRTLGIDISHHNGRWDPSKMDPAIRFVLHKATEGSTFVDPRYAEHRALDPRPTGQGQWIIWGAYHVLRETSPLADQVAHFVETAALRPGEIAALDIETRHAKALVERLGQSYARGAIGLWLGEVQRKTGANPLVYISRRGLKALGLTVHDLDPLWWVDYEPQLSPEQALNAGPSALLWQYTSSQPGAWAGVTSEHVDVNVCSDLEALRSIAVAPRIEPLLELLREDDEVSDE